MNTELHLSLLGKLQIQLDGAPLSGFVSTKAQALLCYLAVTARPHERLSLASLLWGERPESEARTNLRTVLANLRKLLGPYLLIERETIRFNLDSPYWLDVELFQTVLNPIDRAETGELVLPPLRQAIDLYRGEFLEGFSVREAPAFEEWLLAQRERLHQLAGQSLLRLARAYSQRNELAMALELTSRLLALEPWREEAHRQMMLLLAQSGERSAALAQYEQCRQRLWAELGVEPGVETQALYERLKQVGATRPHNLPPQPTPFVGREKELAQIKHYLSQPEQRLVSLVGLGGVGKSRLGLQAARQSLELFQDGVYFVPLVAVNSVEGLLSGIASSLNFGLSGPLEPKQQLFNHLHNKKLLLVLDNFEQLLGDESGVRLLAELLQAAAGVKLLVTTRERLKLAEEWVLEVTGLTYPRKRDAEVVREGTKTQELLNRYSAVAFFVQQAQRVQAEFELGPNVKAILTLCRLLEGMPLGLELAATWLPVLSCQELVAEIERDLSFLEVDRRNVVDRHRSMRAVFESSWQLLAVGEQQVLKRLAVFRGGFEREAAAQVAGASLSLLLGLLSKSLVRRNATGRYDMHELVRQFAAEKLAQEDEAVAVQRRQHGHYYLMLVEQAEPELRGSNQVAWIQRLEVELDNLRAALAWTIEQGEAELGLRLAAGLGWFWRIHGQLTEGRDWLTKILALPHAQTKSVYRAKALNMAALLAYYQVDYTNAQALYEESAAISEAGAADAVLAQSLHGLGNVLWYQNRQAEAISLLEQSLALYCKLNNQAGVAASLSRLGAMASYRGDYESARHLSEQSLVIYKNLGDRWGTVYALWNLAEATIYGQHDYEAARLLFEQCLAIARELRDKIALTAALVGLADLALVRQDYPQVEAYAGEGLTLSQEIGDQWQPPRMMRLLGYAALHRGHANQALPLFIESVQLNQRLADRRGIIAGLVAIARLASSQQQHEMAAQWLGAVETALTTIKDQLLPADQTIYAQTIMATQSALNSESVMEPIIALGAYGVEPLGGEPAEASTPSPAVMEPMVASGADGVEPLGGGPAKASSPSPAFKAAWAKGAALTLEEAIQLGLGQYDRTNSTAGKLDLITKPL